MINFLVLRGDYGGTSETSLVYFTGFAINYVLILRKC